MSRIQDDVGEPTITLKDGTGQGERRLYVRLGGLLLLAYLCYLVWRIVTPLWEPLLWAVLLGALLAPWNLRLAQRLGGRTQLASSITTALTVLLFILPVLAAAGAVTAQAAQLLRRIERRVPELSKGTEIDLSRVPWLDSSLAWLDANTSVSLAQLQGWFTEGLQRLLQVLMKSGGSVVMSALGTVVSFVVMLFVLFFVLRDGPALARQVVRMAPVEQRRRTLLWQHLSDVTRAVFLGIGLTALAQGVLLGVGFWIAGLPSPLVFGVIGVILALIPMVGPALLWVPAAIWLAIQGQHGYAIFLALWGAVVVSLVDNLLRPLLISGRAEVPTLAVFVGVMGGLAAFGFIGLFVGPIVLGLLVALFRFEAELNAVTDKNH
jgi:predicted PurR-regulated permease PerM